MYDRKRIPGFNNYEIDTNGNVYSINRKVNGTNLIDSSEIKLQLGYVKINGKNDYVRVGLTNDEGIRVTKNVHRLVAEIFIPNPENKPEVNHKDGNKHNNNIYNLEWVTKSENGKHKFSTLNYATQYGEKNGMVKLTENQAIEIIEYIIHSDKSNQDLGKMYNVHPNYISLIRHKSRWKYLWESKYKKYLHIDFTKEVVPNYKLSINTQVHIIKKILTKKYTLKELSIKYNIDRSILSRVKNNKTWKKAWSIVNKCPTTIETTSKDGRE